MNELSGNFYLASLIGETSEPERGFVLNMPKAASYKKLSDDIFNIKFQLPIEATEWANIVEIVERTSTADCQFLARAISKHKYHAIDPPESWSLDQTWLTDPRLDQPGVTIAYARRKADQSATTVHWATSCGLLNIMQVMGVGEPIVLTNRTTPLSLYGADSMYICEPTAL